MPADTPNSPISAPDGASAPTASPIAPSAAPHNARSTTTTRSGREVKIPVRFQKGTNNMAFDQVAIV